ncbi:hypothetical protein [Actinoplanes regularis]|uniref:hypothetical protein n=1 Tax=Actinoplanes regularis TaxID=52697 RepID=UPI0024A2FE0A|nr:hypothetical protein [Actinoplanes regularis]GLW33682.1 hypothetical protein Areg01_66200 [Actinoplanes regularis]
MFVEVIGTQLLPDQVDRDDVEDFLVAAMGGDGEVTGAGSGSGRWHLDVEVATGIDGFETVLKRLAATLVDHDLGWVLLRPERNQVGTKASEIF